MQIRIEDTQNFKQQNDKILFIPGFQWRCTSKAIRVRASKGSNYSCLWGASSKEHQNLEYTFNISNPSLEERIEILKGGYYGKTFPKNHPIFKSKKSELETELRARGYDVLNKDKSQLQEKLTSSLRRIQKPPALLTTTDGISDLVSQYTTLRVSS